MSQKINLFGGKNRYPFRLLVRKFLFYFVCLDMIRIFKRPAPFDLLKLNFFIFRKWFELKTWKIFHWENPGGISLDWHKITLVNSKSVLAFYKKKIAMCQIRPLIKLKRNGPIVKQWNTAWTREKQDPWNNFFFWKTLIKNDALVTSLCEESSIIGTLLGSTSHSMEGDVFPSRFAWWLTRPLMLHHC